MDGWKIGKGTSDFFFSFLSFLSALSHPIPSARSLSQSPLLARSNLASTIDIGQPPANAGINTPSGPDPRRGHAILDDSLATDPL